MIRLTTQMVGLVNFYYFIALLFGLASFVTCQGSSSSISSSGSNVQQVSTATTTEPPFVLTQWDAFNSVIRLTANFIHDQDACKPEIFDKTHACYNELKEKWSNGGTEKRFCCFAQDVLDCFYELVPQYCDAKGTEAYLSPEKQEIYFRSTSKDICGSYHSFWHCSNGIPIVVGATCGALLVILLVVIGVIYYLRKRQGSSSLNRGDL